MDIKVRKVDSEVVDKLNEMARDQEISREELLRRILKNHVDGWLLEENPLYKTLSKSNEVLLDVKYSLISLEEKLRQL